MPLWIKWLTEHWFTFLIILGVVVAITYVVVNREDLLHKE